MSSVIMTFVIRSPAIFQCQSQTSSAIFRVKVDLTRYTEKHAFVFDEVFDENDTNEDVC